MDRQRGKHTSRTKARKRAADILFEADQKGLMSNPAAILDLLQERVSVGAPSPLPEYSQRIVAGVAGELPAIDRALGRHAKGAGLDRIPAVDLAIMRVAVWEMLNNGEEVPPITAIDEAVRVVKDLSTDDSPAYVNAVLDAVRKELDDPWKRTPVAETPEVAEAAEAELAPETLDDDEAYDEY